MRIGLDIGSTTLKCVVLDENGKLIHSDYERHYSRIAENSARMLRMAIDKCPLLAERTVGICVSGSAGMGLSQNIGIEFVQEVYATRAAVNRYAPGTSVVIELGGEDAKILFLEGNMEVRMNGSCAGGTGAFIDQMATLLNITPDEMDVIAAKSTWTYTIASRCGVFAKSDIQPLLNQGASKNDIAASIFDAVVNQTIAGLAQGREIKGSILYLGGPLTFLKQLRSAFDRRLGTTGICPDNSLFFVALGAAIQPVCTEINVAELAEKLENYRAIGSYIGREPLFRNEAEYAEFKARHNKNNVVISDTPSVKRGLYVGIDAGSTTVKAVAIDDNDNIVMSRYISGRGNPIPIICEFLTELYEKVEDGDTPIIAGSACTGYGEDLIRNAFNIDFGIVETIAHFTAAAKFRPDVDFIIDIGGQDIKCFKIHNGAIDNIFLNEACSSGCGSFLQTFAEALGYTAAEFAAKGIFADNPVDLGSRCTVFMNSSVKQAQKDGASVENISAGLSVSVVKNALYKVIRAVNADTLGDNIVVQGGTFLSDAVLRAFEQETGRNVIRPNIAGLMGAYGAALYAKRRSSADIPSKTIDSDGLAKFTHEVRTINCSGCENHCCLTVNKFSSGKSYISGNRCEKPLLKSDDRPALNLYEYKRELLATYDNTGRKNSRGRVGIPMGLNMYELYPFWYTIFDKLGFELVRSPKSTHQLYLDGQHTIPSDTICYPAKLLHGHIEALIAGGAETIFYPCMSYNVNEKKGDNHYNCPVVAYYPEVLAANVPALKNVTFIMPYLGPHRRKDFPGKLHESLKEFWPELTAAEVKRACDSAYVEYRNFMSKVRRKGSEYMAAAKRDGLQVIILAGRPYHIDPEICHGIDKLVCDMGAVVLTEDSVSHLVAKFATRVLNQWTYHSRMYAAAKYIGDSGDNSINLVQLVSFGCGVDAITTDEVRRILEEKERIYTQIKIDEITNLGAVKIRLRSLFAALEMKEEKGGR